LKKILLISDTHSDLDDFIIKYAMDADEIWHAGDIGNIEWFESFSKTVSGKTFRGVYGNIDDTKVRVIFPKVNSFEVEKVKVVIIHIAGSYSNLNLEAKKAIEDNKPKIFICGHSHVLKVQYNSSKGFLFMNPGAAGNHGFHKVRTMLKFEIENGEIKNLNVIETSRKNLQFNS
jgi:putative phosphoesterase